MIGTLCHVVVPELILVVGWIGAHPSSSSRVMRRRDDDLPQPSGEGALRPELSPLVYRLREAILDGFAAEVTVPCDRRCHPLKLTQPGGIDRLNLSEISAWFGAATHHLQRRRERPRFFSHAHPATPEATDQISGVTAMAMSLPYPRRGGDEQHDRSGKGAPPGTAIGCSLRHPIAAPSAERAEGCAAVA